MRRFSYEENKLDLVFNILKLTTDTNIEELKKFENGELANIYKSDYLLFKKLKDTYDWVYRNMLVYNTLSFGEYINKKLSVLEDSDNDFSDDNVFAISNEKVEIATNKLAEINNTYYGDDFTIAIQTCLFYIESKLFNRYNVETALIICNYLLYTKTGKLLIIDDQSIYEFKNMLNNEEYYNINMLLDKLISRL